MSGTQQPGNATGSLFTIPDHELLRRIGDGSYGEVWLARSATGTLRAVKIVQERSFDNSRPYEREFNGLVHFEPLSRGHDGLMDILQVGRSLARSGFYCIMELADSATPPSVSAAREEPEWMSYQPLTLDVLIRQRGGRLPARDCIAIAVKLAEALRYLHAAGLVHRDIKPANIIFVGGEPKLADVGLVARTCDARTLVGTEGFLPPEGPGTPRADLYSLGKCLYEMAMGKDRLQFPSPPTLLDALPDRKELLELNEIITCACEPDPACRYQSADAMLADLRTLAAGRSVLAARALKARFRIAAWSAAVVLVGAACWLGVSAGWRHLRRLVAATPLMPPPSGIVGSSELLRVVREFQMPGGWPVGGVKTGDFDGDGEPDLFYSERNLVHAVSAQGEPLLAAPLPGFDGDSFQLQAVLNVNHDPGDEMVAAWSAGTNLILSICDHRYGGLGEVARFSAEGSLWRSAYGLATDSSISFCGLIQPPGIPDRCLLAALNSTYSLQPRSLRCYDFATGQLLWEQPVAGGITGVSAINVDGGGCQELLVAVYSPGNGHRAAGEDDAHGCLLALSPSDGHRLWSVTTGGMFVRTLLQTPSVGNSNLIYALAQRSADPLVSAKEPLPPEARLMKLTPGGRELARREFPLTVWSHAVTDLRGSGRLAVLATDSQGCLHELDPDDLRPVRDVQVVPRTRDWVDLTIEAVTDLDADGRKEIVLYAAQIEFVSGVNQGRPNGTANVRRTHDICILIYDDQLRLVARRELAKKLGLPGNLQISVLPPRADGKREIGIFTDKALFLELLPR